MKNHILSRFGRRARDFSRRLTVLLLVFSFFIQPVATYAQASTLPAPAVTSPVSPVAAIDTTSNTPTTNQPLPATEPLTSFNFVDPQGNVTANQPEQVGSVTKEISSESADEAKKIDSELNPQLMAMAGSSDLPPVQTSDDNRVQLRPDFYSGALNYQYKITVPPGRNGMTPSVTLVYNNQTSDEISSFGYGWGLDTPYIERINKTGTNNLYSSTYFSSSFDGELATTSTTTSAYGAKIENGSFRKYTYSSDTWTVTDKTGTQYKFGYGTSTRMDDPSDSSKIYRWMLEEVRDKNDNYVKYEYYKESGNIYPYRITYTGNGSTDGIYQVEFSRQDKGTGGYATSTRPAFNIIAKYGINQIQVKLNGSWVRKYDLTYTTGDNTRRWLLDTITETGKDESGSTLTLPATNFDYSKNDTDATVGWHTYSGGWTPDPTFNKIPSLFISGTSTDADQGLRIADVNGDGLNDFIWAQLQGTSSSTVKVFLNDGNNNWVYNSNWNFPMQFVKDGKDLGVRLADVNGDLLIDVLWSADQGSGSTTRKTFLNTGSGWSESSTWQPPEYFVANDKDYGLRIADINGDGLSDLLLSRATSTVNSKVYLNNGAGWTYNSSWGLPSTFVTNDVDDRTILVDVNNDGLNDFLTSTTTYINTGKGWTNSPNWAPPVPFTRGIRYADANGDNLVDVLVADSETYMYGDVRTLLNNGNGWTEATNWEWDVPWNFEQSLGVDEGVRMADIDGDGMIDTLLSQKKGATTTNAFLLNEASRSDQLTKVTTDRGAVINVTYKQSPLYRLATTTTLANPFLPVNLDLVSNITTSNGVNLSVSNDYLYDGGQYYFGGAYDRKLAGFATTTEKNALGYMVKTFYHQGSTTQSSLGEYNDTSSKIGKPYRVEVTDASNNALLKKINRWENVSLSNDRNFVKQTQAINVQDIGKLDTFDYDDTNGNLSQKITYGRIIHIDSSPYSWIDTWGTVNDKYTYKYQYATSSSGDVNLTSQETVTDVSGNKIKETRYYYDTQTLGNATKGNITKQENFATSSTYIDFEKSYDSYGLVTQDKDPRDKTTDYTYDSYNLYPATTTNAISQNSLYQYDYTSGKVKQYTDPNGFVFQTAFDAFDRPIEEKQPSTTTPSSLETKTTYTYTDNVVPNIVKRSDYLDSSNSVDTYKYIDGFGRVLQERKEAEKPNEFVTKDYVYNSTNLLDSETLPYFSTGSSQTTPTNATKLYVYYQYDPLQRITKITNAVGSTTNSYLNWVVTTLDPRSKQKSIERDAYGNIVQVIEKNGASSYTTSYEYNGLNNLTKMIDAASNIRLFRYDGLGRRLNAQDLHASADATFGSTTFSYDATGNLTQKIDPKNQTVNYSYDDLNRILTEDYTGQAGTETSYGYDGCTNGKGQICVATSTGAIATYTYDPLGRVASEVKKINDNTFTSTNFYDRQGNVLKLVYPDMFEVYYSYNNAGLPETIQKRDSATSSLSDLVTNVDYAPTGQSTLVSYGNGTENYYIYNPDELYRLQRKLTQKAPTGGEGYNGYLSKNDYLIAEKSKIAKDGTAMLINPEELPELDTERSKTYLVGFTPNGDEIKRTRMYTGGVAYKNKNGDLEPIDTTLVDTATGWLTYTAPYSVQLENSVKDGPVVFENGDQILGLTFPTYASTSKNVTIEKDVTSKEWAGKRVTYKNYLGDGIDLDIKLNDEALIKDFVINKKSSLPALKQQTTVELPFEMIGNNTLDVEIDGKLLSKEKSITSSSGAKIIDDQGNVTYLWEPHAKDSSHSGNGTNISLRYDLTDIGIKITKILPSNWLQKATYPVITDAVFSPYPSSGDGVLVRQYVDATWSAIRSGSSASYVDSTSGNDYAMSYYDDPSRTPSPYGVHRMFLPFDTSYLANATITSATLWTYANSNPYPGGYVVMSTTTQASTTTLSSGEYSSAITLNSPTEIANRKNSNDWITTGYTRWDLNATGTAAINKTGYTKIGIRSAGDVDNTTPSAYSRYYGINIFLSEASGTSTDPYLEVNYVTATSSSLIQDINYVYDASGNITKITDNSGNSVHRKILNLTYDDLNRLTSASTTAVVYGPNYKHDYSYDQIGNISYKSDKGLYSYNGATNGTFANPHAATSIGAANYSYDNNGNLLGIGTGSGTATSTWDYNNRMMSALMVSSPVYTMTYDHNGDRVNRTSSSGSSVYYPTKGYDVTATSTRDKHIYLNDNFVATVQSTSTGTTTYYVHNDHLGGTTDVTNTSGAVVEAIDYFPSGYGRADTASSYAESKKYIGQESDIIGSSGGYSYLNARYYDGWIGRFASQDPSFLAVGNDGLMQSLTGKNQQQNLANPQSLNSYSYALNNPYRFKDQNGMWFQEVMSGQQSISDFQGEVGQAALQMSSDSRIWDSAISNPITTGAIVGVSSGAVVAGASALFSSGYVGTIPQWSGLIPETPQLVSKDLITAQRSKILGNIENPNLKKALEQVFRPQDRYPGGTAGALTREAITGQNLSPAGHLIKAGNVIQQLGNIARIGGLSQGDINRLYGVAQSLQKAINLYNKLR